MSTRRVLSGLLLTGLTSIVLSVGLLTMKAVHWMPPEAVAPDGALTSDLPSVNLVPSGSVSPPEVAARVAARPLFEASRSPVVPVEDVPIPVAGGNGPSLAQAVLLGVFDSGADAGAIVSVAGNVVRVRRGETTGGWTLSSLDGSEAVFRHSSGVQETLSIAPRAPTAQTVQSAADRFKALLQARLQEASGSPAQNNPSIGQGNPVPQGVR